MNTLLAALLWLALTPLGLTAGLLPRGLELSLGRALGRLYLRLDRRRRTIAEENLRRCLPELGAAERARLLRANFEHYGMLAFELLHMFSPLPGHYRAYCRRVSRLEGLEHWQRAHDKGRGVLFVSAHLGNWEQMAAQGALHGIPLTMVTRRLKPEWLHRQIERARLSVGARAVYAPRTMPTVLEGLRRGESIGFVLDQYAPPPMGIPALFFGIKVDTLGAVGALASRTGAAIVPVLQKRAPNGLVRVIIEPELELDAAELKDAVRVTERFSAKIEAWIRDEPAQWLWAHRRFKNAAWPDARQPVAG